MSWNPNGVDIIDYIVSIQGLYDKVFGKLLPYLIYNNKYEGVKKVLSDIYDFDDIEQLFWKKVDKKEFKGITKILFRTLENNANVWLLNKKE